MYPPHYPAPLKRRDTLCTEAQRRFDLLYSMNCSSLDDKLFSDYTQADIDALDALHVQVQIEMAATELLSACKLALKDQCIELEEGEFWLDERNVVGVALRDAIAKAEGK